MCAPEPIEKSGLGKPHRPHDGAGPEAGYALPSVLILLTLLTIVAFSVILLQYLRRHIALLEVSRVKAEYAAQSGITSASCDRELLAVLPASAESACRRYQFSDGSTAEVSVGLWGAYVRVCSTGKHKTQQAVRTAFLGRTLSRRFAAGLVFGSMEHQLVLSGNTSIVGDLETGVQGVTTGSLPGFKTPRVVPVAGRIRANGATSYAGYDRNMLGRLRNDLGASLASHALVSERSLLSAGPVLNVSSIPDSVEYLSLAGGSRLEGTSKRLRVPLTIVAGGECTISRSAELTGFTKIVAAGPIVVEKGAVVDGPVLMSTRSIVLRHSASIRGQLIAPCVELDTLSSARYPSLALAFSFVPNQASRPSILIREGATVEGFAGVAESGTGILHIERGASLLGIVHSAGTMTQDGVVFGCVMTRDLSFYLAPTRYRGWLREGIIDRTALPPGALLPMVLEDPTSMRVLQWW